MKMAHLTRRGFTLSEMTVAWGGMTILGAVIFVVYLITLRGLAVLNSHYALISFFQSTIEQLERDIHFSSGRLADNAVCGAGPTSYTAGPLVLILVAPGIGGTGVDRVVYRLAGSGTLERILLNSDCSVSFSTRALTLPPVTIKPVSPVLPGLWFNLEMVPVVGGVTVRLGAQSTVGGYTTSGKIAVRYNFRNP